MTYNGLYAIKLNQTKPNQSHMVGSNVHRVSRLTTTALPTTYTIQCYNCFLHIIYTPQTSSYQNIANLLTHSNYIPLEFSFSFSFVIVPDCKTNNIGFFYKSTIGLH